MTALEVYDETISYVQFKVARGALDRAIGNDVVEYLREDLRRRLHNWLPKRALRSEGAISAVTPR